ncbi:MAG: hypothetical protein FK731_13065 [Asgard group archaeon]|nr:hypothetical protein [Asgard group archaeon]
MTKNILNYCILLFLISFLVLDTSFIMPKDSIQTSEQSDKNYNIILMIGDGMGFEQIRLARYIEVGIDQNLTIERLNYNSSVITLNYLSEITDSAAAATAIATGVKTYNRRIAIAPNGSVVKTILEISQEYGKATGIVTTAFIQHATPASFMTHVIDRALYTEITNQIINDANVDILLGGGLDYFTLQQIESMKNQDYNYVTNKTELESISSGKILGLFANGYLDYDLEREYNVTPSIAEMTKKALEILEQNSSGFFLMVEGGRIDHACHANNKTNAALEGIAFDYAVREALNYVKNHDNTILIVTTDHETGGLAIVNENLDQNLPISGLTEEQNETIRITRANQIDVAWSTTGHTDFNVPFWAYGKALENTTINPLIDNTDIFYIMKEIIIEPEDNDETPTTPTPTYITPSSLPPKTSSVSMLIIIIPISLISVYFFKVIRKSYFREEK